MDTKENKDQEKPRRPISAYNIFFQAERQRLLEMAEGKKPDFRNLAKYVSAKWKMMTASDKVEYVQRSFQDKKRFALELLEWHQKRDGGNLCVSNTDVKETETVKIAASDDPHHCQPIPLNPKSIHIETQSEFATPERTLSLSSPSSSPSPSCYGHYKNYSEHGFTARPCLANTMIPCVSPLQGLDPVETIGSLHWVANELGRDGVQLLVDMFAD